jgi:outer membrane protein assembly factor BamD (BamD/ComL family)
MSFKFECPHCGKRLSAEPQHAGRTVPCPGCKAAFTVPVAPSEQSDPPDAEVDETTPPPENESSPENSPAGFRSTLYLGIAVALLIVGGIVFWIVSGPTAEEEALLRFESDPGWKQARAFAEFFPESVRLPEIETTMWILTRATDTIEEYRMFVTVFPDSDLAPKARKLELDLAFSAADAAASLSEWENFLRDYPDSVYENRVREALDDHVWNSANTSGRKADYEAYLASPHASAHRDAAMRRIDDLVYAELAEKDTQDAYEEYLKQYPSGLYAKDARSRIATIPQAEKEDQWKELADRIYAAFSNGNADEARRLIAEAASLKAEGDRVRQGQWQRALRMLADAERRAAGKEEREAAMAKWFAEGTEALEEAIAAVEEDLKEKAARARRLEAAMMAYTKENPISLELAKDFSVNNMSVAGFDGDHVLLSWPQGEVEYRLDHLPPDLMTRLLRNAIADATAHDYLHIGKVFLKTRNFEMAEDAFSKAKAKDATIAPLLPDVEKIRLSSRVFQGDFELNGNQLDIEWRFQNPDEQYDFSTPEGELSVKPGEGLEFKGSPKSVGQVKAIPFSDRVKATCVPTPSSTGAHVFGIRYSRPDGQMVMVYATILGNQKQVRVERQQGGKTQTLKQQAGYTPGSQIMVALADGRLVVRLNNDVIWAGEEAGFSQVFVIAGGRAYNRGNMSVVFQQVAVSGAVDPDWIAKKTADYRDVLNSELSRDRRLAKGKSRIDFAVTIDEFLEYEPEAARKSYQDSRKLLLEAAAKGDNKLLHQAYKKIEAIVNQYPGFPHAAFLMGKLHTQFNGTVSGTAKYFEEALEREPDFPEALAGLAQIDAQLLQWHDVEKRVTRALELKPDLPQALMLKARLLVRDEQFDEAIKLTYVVEKLAPLDPKLSNAAKTIRNLIHGPGWRKTSEHKSRHYIVRSDLSEDQCRVYAEHMEAIRGWYQEVVQRPPLSREKAEILVFNTRQGYYGYAEFTSGSRLEQTLGVFLPQYGQMMLFEDADEQATLSVMYHEGFHQYLNGVMTDAPIWFNEGMAEYVGGTRIRGGKVVATGQIQQGRLRNLRQALTGGWRPLAFKTIMLEPKAQFYSKNPSFKYAQSWSMCHFFFHFENGKYKKVWRRYINLMLDGVLPKPAFDQTFAKENLDAMQREWLNYVQKMKME